MIASLDSMPGASSIIGQVGGRLMLHQPDCRPFENSGPHSFSENLVHNSIIGQGLSHVGTKVSPCSLHCILELIDIIAASLCI